MIVSSYSLRRRATYLASAIDQLPGPDSNPDLLAVALLEADPRGLTRLRIFDRDLGHVQRRLGADDAALRTRLRRLGVPGMDVDAGNQHLAVLRHHLGDLAVTALVLAGQDDDLVAFLDLRSGHYKTSGARLMIFMCFLARSSRTTGPKMRVPIVSWLLLISTAAFESKRMVEPSGRLMSLAVRTITALWTSPFFTRPRGAASLTETTMMSPTPAKRRLEPPSTLMHWTRLAPLLSATSRLVCIWIIDPIPSLHFNRNESGDQLHSGQASAVSVSGAASAGASVFFALAGFFSALSGVACVSTRPSTFQVFSLEIGAVSSMRTVSPSRYSLPSSWAWYF